MSFASEYFYDILHPTFDNDTQYRSEDLQVNGLGIYRTVEDGVEPLLVERVRFPAVPAYTFVTPDALLVLPAGELYPQMSYHATGMHFGWQYTINNFAWTNDGDQGAILAGADSSVASPTPASIQGIGYQITYSHGSGSYGTHRWESDTTTQGSDSIIKGTYLWEGTNSQYMAADASTVVMTSPMPGVRFYGDGRINNSPGAISKTGNLAGVIGNLSKTDETTDIFTTQIWEVRQFDKDLEEEMNDVDGNINSQDASGRHATHRWEIDQLDVTQSWYWGYQDTVEDNALGEAVEIDNDVPPPGDILSIFQEHAFLAGDPDNPHYLYWSKRFKPESWPPDNYSEIGTAADPIRAHMPVAGVLGVFTTQTKYHVSGNDTSGFIHNEAISHRGAPSPRSVIATDKGVLFVARDGVFSTNFIGPDAKLSDAIDPIFYGETRDDYSPINWAVPDQIVAGFYKNKYYFSYPAGTAIVNTMTAVYSFDIQQWSFWNVGFSSFFTERDTDLFLAGRVSEHSVFVIDDPQSKDDDGVDIDLTLQTKDFSGGSRTTRNLFLYFKVDADCDGDSVTAKFYVDDVLISTQTIEGDRLSTLLSLPENSFGQRWHVRLSYAGHRRIAVYGVTTIYIPLLAA